MNMIEHYEADRAVDRFMLSLWTTYHSHLEALLVIQNDIYFATAVPLIDCDELMAAIDYAETKVREFEDIIAKTTH